MTTPLERALADDPARLRRVGLTRAWPCRACGGRVVCNWAHDYAWGDGSVTRARTWHCVACGRSYVEAIEDTREAERRQPTPRRTSGTLG